MNNPDNSSNLPEVLEANWGIQQVEALFDDLQRGAEIKHVQVRYVQGANHADSAVTLDKAKQLLDEGAAKAIQIHYDFDGQKWCDTLMVTPPTIRITRTNRPPHH